MERSRFITVALVVFSVLTVVNGRHLIAFDSTHLVVIVAVAITVHVVANLCSSRRKLQPISPLISFALLVQLLLITNARGTFSKMFPTPGTIIDLIHDTREGIIEMRTGEIPITFTISVFLVAIVVTWIVAEIGETLAQRLHSSAPTLIWYIIINASIVAQDGATYPTVAVFSICAASWFFLYAFDKSHERAHSHTIDIPRSAQLSNLTTYIAAFIVLAIISTVLVVPVKSLPSVAPNNLFNFLNNSSNQNELSPLVGMKEQLTSTETQTMFTATASEAQYWRTNVLTDFDGQSWTSSSKTQQTPELFPQGVETRSVSGSVRLDTLAPTFLPTYFSTQTLSVREVDFLKNGVVYSRDDGIKQYSINAQVPPSDLTPEQVEVSSGGYPKNIIPYTLLPISFDDENPIVIQAQEIASNRGSIYEQAIALRDFFLDDSFTYDLDVDYSSSTNAMISFLDQRRGFCEQFATTYAAFARSVGIPSRVVVGFTPGEPDASGTFTVTNLQAHAWAEVYLSNFGWLTIDPTPPGSLPGQAPSNIGAVVATTVTASAATTVAPQTQPTTSAAATTPQDQKDVATKEQRRSPILLFAVGAIVVVSLAAAAIARARRRKSASKSDRLYVVQTFNTLGERVLNVPPKPDLTIAELVESVPENNEVIREFLALLTLASYAPDADISWQELRAAAGKARAEKISK